MKHYEELIRRSQEAPVFLKHEFEGALIKFQKGKALVKFPGKPEFQANKNSNLVTEALMEGKEISEGEYEKG